MPGNPNRLVQFWQELKRRKVIQVISVYAGAAFVIIELVNNITEPLRLPGWTPTLVIIILLIGFPLAVIFSWIFDIGSEGGIVKTEPADKVEPGSPPRSSVGWKVASYISFLVIVVMSGILIYPKIFKQDRLKELRDREGMISVAVLPFDNLTGDSSMYFWQNGISEYLISGLATSEELAVSSSQVVSDVLEGTRQVYSASLTPEIARRTASKINASIYITGNYIGAGNDFTIILNLVNTGSGEVIWSTRVDGDLGNNYRSTLDRLSDTVRNYMEIKALEGKVETDLSNAYPNSAEAYRHYIDGLNAIVASNYESAIESLLTAYEIDTTFTFAAFYLALAHNFSGRADLNQGTDPWTIRAYELRKNLPPAYRPWIELWYACIVEDAGDIRRCLNLLSQAALHSRFLLLDLAVTYSDMLGDYNKSIQEYEKLEALNRKWEDDWKYIKFYTEYAWTLLMADRPEDVSRIAETGLRIDPENGWLKLYRGSSNVMLGDTVAINKSIDEIKAAVETYNLSESDEERFIGLMYRNGKDFVKAEEHYRKAYRFDPENRNRITILARLLIESDIDVDEGLALSEKGLGLFPDDQQLLKWKGLALHKLGKDEEALAILNKTDELIKGYDWQLAAFIQDAQQALARQNSLL